LIMPDSLSNVSVCWEPGRIDFYWNLNMELIKLEQNFYRRDTWIKKHWIILVWFWMFPKKNFDVILFSSQFPGIGIIKGASEPWGFIAGKEHAYVRYRLG
jgi:hypothetical protein